MTKILVSIPDNIHRDLQRLRKETEMTQSNIISTALAIYITMAIQDKDNMIHLKNIILSNSKDSLYDLIGNLKRLKENGV